ncbi:MAG: leucine-rich repeat domain-containing protein [Promethearchaeota archaeon]
MIELDPSKIYEDFSKELIEKSTAIDKLIVLIENSNNIQTRLKSIIFLEIIGEDFKDIGIIREDIFKLFENLLISDHSENIRNYAAKILGEKFLDISIKPLRWALLHEQSALCLNTIFRFLIIIIKNLDQANDLSSKLVLVRELKQMYDNDLRIGFELLIENNDINSIETHKLSLILINYFSLIYLKKSFWRLKYKVEDCKVTEINFQFKGLIEIPEAVQYLDSLIMLILRYNQITSVPKWIEKLKYLEVLNLNINNIKDLPESIGSLSYLKDLSLWRNEVERLPNSICNLKSLESLNLRLNRLKELPLNIGSLKSLKELNLHDNKLKTLPNSIKNLILLQKLNLSWNQLQTIPDSVKFLSNLIVFDIERNELSYIPEVIGELINLEILNLSDNNLTAIPNTIGSLKNLKYLNLSRNKLESLPESLNSLSSLKELNLSDNKLKEIPSTLKNLETKGLTIYY